MRRHYFRPLLIFAMSLLACGSAFSQRQMEKLGRGVIAMKSSSTQVYVGWRLLGNDPAEIAFNLYRSANGAAAVKINGNPLTATTDYLDTPANLSTTAYSYSVKPVLNGVEVADTWANPLSGPASLPANAPTRQYIPVPMQPTPDDAAAGVSYAVKFCWVGDFDGDGEYDFLVDRTNPSIEAKQWLQAYKRDGTLLWQMDMGPNSVNHYNITPGSSSVGIGHGDNVTVYDLDGDGKAEAIIRTANGVVFANGTTLTAPDNEVQYISIIDGMTGQEKARATVPIPATWATKTHVQGQMGIVYADGVRPSLFFHPSNRNADSSFNKFAVTWDYRNGALTQRWVWLESGHTAEGHQIRFADVDNDGKDEYVDIGNVVKSDGSGQINENVLTEVVHGDRFHVADIDPDRPGLETFLIQQNNSTGLATAYHAADKSAVIKKWYAGDVVDVGRGTIGAFVPNLLGLQFFSTQPGVFDCKTNQIYDSGPFPPETIWWDGDLGREFLSTIGSSATSPGIDKFNTANGGSSRVLSLYSDPNAPNSPYNNYIAYGGRPQFWGDILGDWREELICAASDNSELRIYTTKTPDVAKTGGGVPFRIYTLMHNPQYRIQATTKGYVQSSYVDYYLGYNMTPPPPPPMVDAKLVWRGGEGATTWDVGATQSWLNSGTNSTFANGDTVRFDISGDNTTAVTLAGTLQPGELTVYNPKDYTFAGAGTLAGTMKLTKSGAGSLILPNTHTFTGKTTIWDGALVVNGNLQGSPVTVWGGTWGGALAAGKTGGRIGGAGTFSQPVTLKYRGAITPGAGMANAGTLTLGAGLTAEDGSVLALDLSNDPGGLTTPSDRIAVTGNLSLSGKVKVVIKTLNGQLAPGTYTLLTYTGTLTGGLSNLEAIVPVGTPYTMAAGGGAITLTVPVTRAAAAITWRGSGGNWDLATSQNWLRAGSPDLFVSGDTITFDANGVASPAVTLVGGLPIAGINVNSTADYTFSGGGYISGSGGLAKSGTGTLTISTANDYTGPTTITGGVLAVSMLGDAGEPGSIGAASAAASNLVINGGTLRLTGSQSSTNRSLTLGSSGGTLDVATASSSIQISGVATGTGKLTKSGPGTLILASANTYTGGTLISEGTIYLAGATPNSSGLGAGSVTLSNGTLSMADVQASETAAWNLIVPAGATGRVNADGRCQLSGTLTGAGDLTFYTPYVRTEMDGNWSAFAGRIFVISDADGGNFRIRNSAGYPNAALDIGDNVYAFYNQSPGSNLTIPIGTLSGTSTAYLAGCNLASRTVTWQVGARNENSTFAGIIANATGPSALTKVGAGTLTLSGANTYTGATTVSAGRLQINGSSSATSYTVQSGATLGGSGTITGNVTVQTGGALEHGAAGATPLAITGNLTLPSSVIIRPAAGVNTEGTYTVLTYTGTLTGTPTFTWDAPAGSYLVATFNASTPGVITMTLTAPPRTPGPIIWTGATDFNWDASTANWTVGGAPVTYLTGDSPAFTDAGNAASPVLIAGNPEPMAVVVNATKDYTFGGTGSISGAATLTKSGAGTLTVSTAQAFTGGTTIQGGTVLISNAASLGTGPVTLNGGTWATGGLAPQNSIIVTADSGISGGQSGGQHGLKDISGSGILTLNATSVFDLEGDVSGFSGTFALTGVGSFRFFSSANNGSSSATFDLGTRGLSARSGSAFNLGALAGQTGSTLGMASNSSSSGCIYTIGGNNADSTFAGVIANGSASKLVGIVKTGSGNLTLAGTNTYTGTTTVSAGKLSVTGSLAATATTVATTGALGGIGTIAGAVTCNGTLAPGSPLGTLTLGAGLALASTSTLDYDLGASPDLVAVTGNLTLDGTVNITAGAGFAAGTYTLITYTGSLTNNTLSVGALPAGYTATVSTATAGQVKLVVTSLNTVPQITHAATATPSTATTSQLSITATDDAGEGSLTYTWSATGPAAVGFSPNGTNAAKNSTATFSAPGSYTLTVTVQDVPGLTVVSSTNVTVTATPTTLGISPASATLAVNASQVFTASVFDQFGAPVSNPSITWSSTGGGSISPVGNFTATTAGGPYQISAATGSLSSGVPVTVTKAVASVTLQNLSATYDGAPKPVTAITDPAGLAVQVTYESSADAPAAPGIYPVTAVVDNTNYAGETSASLVIAPPTFASWEAGKFTPAQIAAGESAPAADPDHDGLTNLAEYALGGQPYAFTPQPAVTSDGASMSIIFQRSAWIDDVTYHAESTADLATWQELTLEVLNPGSDPETVRATLPISPPGGHLLRLRFER